MAHIHTKPGQYDHTVSLYIFRTDFEEPKLLLHMHRKIKKYAQFGGHIELNETPWQAVAHELSEESGYHLEQLAVLQPTAHVPALKNSILHPTPVICCTMKYPGNETHGHIDSTYALVTDQAPKGAPAKEESNDIRLFTRQEIETMVEIDPVTREIALAIFDDFLPMWHPVATAQFH